MNNGVGGDQEWKSEYFERMIRVMKYCEWSACFSRVFSLSSALYSPLSGVWYRLRLMYDCFHRHHYYSPPPQNRVGTRIMRPNTFVTSCARPAAAQNKSYNSVNILVRAQVAHGVNWEIFLVDYIYCLLSGSLTTARGRGRLGTDFCWVVGKKCVFSFFEGFWHRLWQN